MNIEDGGEQITNTQDMCRTLKSLQLTRAQLTVKISGDRHSYASMVVHVDIKRRQFVIDELVTDDANQRIAAGSPFTIIAFYEGVRVILKGKSVAARKKHAVPNSIAVDFPAYIYHKQRRNAFRAPVQLNATSSIQLISRRRKTVLEGKITDLSTTGVGCEFTGAVRPDIDKHEHFDSCTVKINGEFELQCRLLARSPNYHRMSDRYTCGFAFTTLDRHQQKTVDHYVLKIQRQARKAQADERERTAFVA